jgi:DNA-binding FadR family transcriptional regulator
MAASRKGGASLKEDLIEKLRNRQLRPGERLPTERELGETYGIGRSAVRRVLTQIKDRGLITQTVGSGTYVSEDADRHLDDPRALGMSTEGSPADLMEARLILEPMLLDLVVRNATATDLAQLEECCSNAEKAQTQQQFEYWDGQLHQRIAAASHNSLIISIYALVTKARENAEWGMLKKKSFNPESRAEYEVDHRSVVSALKNRDVDRAKAALSEHLHHIRQNMFGR